jgi:chaperonin GroEL
MADEFVPGIVFQPAVSQGMQRGINWMVNAIRPTLGPRPRLVAIDRAVGGGVPELLDNGGVIARRIIQIPDRDADAGAMLLRQLLWIQYEREGDGTATAAVILQSVFNQGLAYLASGGNPMQLRHCLEKGAQVILAELTKLATPAEGQDALARVASAVCGDPPLARLLGEIFDIIGEYGQLEVRTSRGRDLEREYVEGMYWSGGALSWQMIAEQTDHRAEVENPAILISDLDIKEPQELVPLLTAVAQAGINSLFIIAGRISDSAMSVLLTNRKAGKLDVVAAKAPGIALSDVAGALEDVACLTGGRPFADQAGGGLNHVRVEDLGRARRAWATRDHFGIVGGQGDPLALREHIAKLRTAFGQVTDPDARKKLRERIGKLMGGSATLWIGGATEAEANMRKELAERTAEAVRGALLEGALPGGGVALLACQKPLRDLLARSTDPDERAAYRILIRGLEEPTRTLIANAGYDPSEVMAEIRLAGPGYGFDVLSERVVDMTKAGILDVASVQRSAVWRAVTGAAIALTTGALVHHKKPQQALNP